MNKMAITGLSLIQLKGNYYVHSKKMQSPNKGKRLPAISENSPSVMQQGTRIKKICPREYEPVFPPYTLYPE
jgi:hypothetical protein